MLLLCGSANQVNTKIVSASNGGKWRRNLFIEIAHFYWCKQTSDFRWANSRHRLIRTTVMVNCEWNVSGLTIDTVDSTAAVNTIVHYWCYWYTRAAVWSPHTDCHRPQCRQAHWLSLCSQWTERWLDDCLIRFADKDSGLGFDPEVLSLTRGLLRLSRAKSVLNSRTSNWALFHVSPRLKLLAVHGDRSRLCKKVGKWTVVRVPYAIKIVDIYTNYSRDWNSFSLCSAGLAICTLS